MKFGKKEVPEPEVGSSNSGSKKKSKKKTIVLQTPNIYVGLASCIAALIVAVAVFAYHSLIILPAQQQAENEIATAELKALNLVFSEKLIGLQNQVAHYAHGIPEQTYTGSEPVRALQAGLVLTSMPGSLRALVAAAGQATRDKKTPLPISFASLDLIRSVEASQRPGLEAFAFQDKWYVQVAAPRIVDNKRVAGTLLVMFDAAVLEPTWSGMPSGDIQLLQSVGNSRQPVIVRGSTKEPELMIKTSLPQWSTGFTPQSDLRSFSDSMQLIVAMVAGGLLAGIFVAAIFILLLRKTKADISYVSAYVESVLTGQPALQPKIQLTLMSELVSIVSNIVQTAGRNKSVVEPAKSSVAGKGKKERSDAVIDDQSLNVGLNNKMQLPEVSEEPSTEQFNDELDEAEPLFQGDSLDIEMLGDDDLLGLNDEDLGLDGVLSGEEQEFDVDDIAENIFRAFDIRGTYGDTLTNAVMVQLGKALGSEAVARGARSICVGMDGRESSPVLSQCLMRGLLSTGLKIVDVGMVPTPVLYFAIDHLQLDAGVMVTGSNDPPENNGLKMVINGDMLTQTEIGELLNRIRSADYTISQGEMTTAEVKDDYVESIVGDIAVATPLKVVVDAGNGVTGELAPNLLTELGCEVVPLNCEIDSDFPAHQPDPGRLENLQDLIARVKETEADLGIALDGDGDQIGVVTNEGKVIWPDRLLMLFAKDVVSRNPGADVVFDVKCSRRLSGLISGFGGRPVMWRSGHAMMKAKMKETGALLAGEMSGHIFFKERWSGFDDGLYSAARLLEILGIEDRDAQSVFDEFPEDFITPELHVVVGDESGFQIMKQLEKKASWGDATISSIDGLRIDYSDGWGLCRASNTAPTLVLRFEAETEEGLQRIQNTFREQLLAVNSKLELPF